MIKLLLIFVSIRIIASLVILWTNFPEIVEIIQSERAYLMLKINNYLTQFFNLFLMILFLMSAKYKNEVFFLATVLLLKNWAEFGISINIFQILDDDFNVHSDIDSWTWVNDFSLIFLFISASAYTAILFFFISGKRSNIYLKSKIRVLLSIAVIVLIYLKDIYAYLEVFIIILFSEDSQMVDKVTGAINASSALFIFFTLYLLLLLHPYLKFLIEKR